MAYKILSDSYLMNMTKKAIVDILRCAEHNMIATEETLAQQIENTKNWEPVTHGEWQEKTQEAIEFFYLCNPELYVMSRKCSVCKRYTYDIYNYSGYQEKQFCPWCGARMDVKYATD